MKKFASFLRGINVGGNKMMKMEQLKKAFEGMGFKNVKTLLNSGNVIFEGSGTAATLSKKIEEGLKKKFYQDIHVITRSIEEIEKLVKQNPFKGIKVTPETRLYVTFLSEKPKNTLKIPYSSPEGDFRILSASKDEVCSMLIVSPTKRSTDLMNILEKEYGKKVTTRNWNTIFRILK